MTPADNTTLVAMYTLPIAMGAWLVAALLVLLAQRFRAMRSWRPILLGATMAAIILSAAAMVVLTHIADQHQR